MFNSASDILPPPPPKALGKDPPPWPPTSMAARCPTWPDAGGWA
ncbi:MAG: hypothetical protein M5U12_12890 [Verrucomicrobia bacterium]|nr:hypothetical protein [Verrucomicrobiota bacterium]